VTSTLADGYCSDEVNDGQLRRAMEVLRDQSGDEEEHRRRVDAFPLEASRTGGASDDDGWRSARRDSRTTLTTSGLAGPVMSSREVKSVQSTCCNVEAGESVSMNNSDGSDPHRISVQSIHEFRDTID